MELYRKWPYETNIIKQKYNKTGNVGNFWVEYLDDRLGQGQRRTNEGIMDMYREPSIVC